MKDWFPFTDYDFYGYIACGLVFLFGFDFWYSASNYIPHTEWNFFQGAVIISLAYVIGQIISIPSSMFFEHGLARKLLRAPAIVLLSDKQTRFEKILEKFIGRHYSPLPSATRNKIFSKAEIETHLNKAQLEDNIEEVLVPALASARKCEFAQGRVKIFRNQYSFNRNMAFTSLLLSFLFSNSFYNDEKYALPLLIFSLIVLIGMTIRFLKFYAACASEVLRTYAYDQKN